MPRKVGRPRSQPKDESPPGLLTVQEVVRRYRVTYQGIWLAEALRLLQPVASNGELRSDRDAGKMSFREFMVSHGFDGPNEDWSSEDVTAWASDFDPPTLAESQAMLEDWKPARDNDSAS